MGKTSKVKSKKRSKKSDARSATPFSDALRVTEGFVLGDVETRATPQFDGDKQAGREALARADDEMDHLQEQLYAHGRTGGTERILLVIQGLDTAGKGGIMRHVVGSVDPQGVDITAFKSPTTEELARPFLWRIRRALPEAGMIGVFDRSHYEDVLIVRVEELVPKATWSRRYRTINNFEQELADGDTTVIKVMLHISKDEQEERLSERLENPEKYWKYNPGDIDTRERWEAYLEAYQAIMDKTSTQHAPWFVVPADRKWYARLAVQQILLEHLRGLNLEWPPADFDIAREKERLAAS